MSQLFGLKITYLSRLSGDGSNRHFFRLQTQYGPMVVIVPGPDGLFEAHCWWIWNQFLSSQGIPVPQGYYFWAEVGIILAEDLGDLLLQEAYQNSGQRALLEEVLEILIRLQRIDPNQGPRVFLETRYYDRRLMVSRESAAFARYFCLEALGSPLPQPVAKELFILARLAETSFGSPVLLHRDFQSRNLMLKEGRLRLIDFQGLRLGPPAYDLASFLKDPYLNLPENLEEELLQIYIQITGENEKTFRRQYDLLALHRLLQALSAFVRLSLAGKDHFRGYIPAGIAKLKALLGRETFSTFASLKAFVRDLPVDVSLLAP
ncbi:phosphotransferase [Thermosulfuriphilus sp.]